MGNNNYTKYDEDFKKSLVSLHQNGKLNLSSAKNMVFLNPHSENGLSNTLPLKSATASCLPPSK